MWRIRTCFLIRVGDFSRIVRKQPRQSMTSSSPGASLQCGKQRMTVALQGFLFHLSPAWSCLQAGPAQ